MAADEGKAGKPVVMFTRADRVEVTPVPWLIEGWLPEDAVVGVVGASGSMKTFLVGGMACSVTTGTPWNGCKVKRGPVFILAGEGINGLRKRIEGWATHSNVPINGASLYLADRLPRLDHVTTEGILNAVEGLRDESEHDPALVIIDTVARAISGDENSSTDMGLLIECADLIRERYTGCTVLLVHHTGHNNNGRARGSSAFYAALDSEILMKPLRSGEVQAHATKCKDWAPPRPLQFKPTSVTITVPGLTEPTSTLVLVNTQVTAQQDHTAEVHELRAGGMSLRAIAAQTNISKSQVERLLKDSSDARPVWESEFDE